MSRPWNYPRRRSVQLKGWQTETERDLLRAVSDSNGLTISDMIAALVEREARRLGITIPQGDEALPTDSQRA